MTVAWKIKTRRSIFNRGDWAARFICVENFHVNMLTKFEGFSRASAAV